ncbi:MAG: HU family DNA-binding protein [Thermaerobacterales bacterium]
MYLKEEIFMKSKLTCVLLTLSLLLALTGTVGAGETKNIKTSPEKGFKVIIDGVGDPMERVGKVGLIGFGSFSVSKLSNRTGRNPQTGKEIKIAAKAIENIEIAVEKVERAK